MTGDCTSLVPCRVCRHFVAQDAKVCPSCGTGLPWKQQDQINREEKSGKALRAGCLIVILTVVVLVSLLLLRSRPENLRGSPEECARILADNMNRASEGRLRDADVAYYEVKCR